MGLVLLLSLVVLREVWEVYQKKQDSSRSREEAEVKLLDLKRREATLRADIAALKTDRGLEDALRREYGVGREGEGLIVIVEPAAEPVPKDERWSIELLQQALPWW